MTEKNKAKAERKAKRKMWTGLYPRRTKTKREKEISAERKHKKRGRESKRVLFRARARCP